MNKIHSFLLLLLTSSIIFSAAQKKKFKVLNSEYELESLKPTPEEIEEESQKIKDNILESMKSIEVFSAQFNVVERYFDLIKFRYDGAVLFTQKGVNEARAAIRELGPPNNQNNIINTAFAWARKKHLIDNLPMRVEVSDDCKSKLKNLEEQLLADIIIGFNSPPPKPQKKWGFLS